MTNDSARPVELDASGYRCPMPVILMEKALRRLPPGGRLRIVADDPVALVDIPHFARAAGYDAARQPSAEGTCVFMVTAKGNPASAGPSSPAPARPQGRHFLSEGGKG